MLLLLALNLVWFILHKLVKQLCYLQSIFLKNYLRISSYNNCHNSCVGSLNCTNYNFNKKRVSLCAQYNLVPMISLLPNNRKRDPGNRAAVPRVSLSPSYKKKSCELGSTAWSIYFLHVALLGKIELLQATTQKTSYLYHICIFRNSSLVKLLLKVEYGKPDIKSNIRSIIRPDKVPPVLRDIQHVTCQSIENKEITETSFM